MVGRRPRGHAAAVGHPADRLPLRRPGWLESAAETGIGLVIFALAARVIWKWGRGDFRVGLHEHRGPEPDVLAGDHRHLRRAEPTVHRHHHGRTPRQAFGIGFLHGLAGTGAIVVLLLAALPSALEAGLALAVFAPMSIVSMAAFTTAFAWLLTRPLIEPLYRTLLIPALGLFGLVFGLWYAGLA